MRGIGEIEGRCVPRSVARDLGRMLVSDLARAVVDLTDDEAEVYASLIGELRAQRAQERADRIAALCAMSDGSVYEEAFSQPSTEDGLAVLRDAGFVRADVRAVYRTAYLRFADRVAIRPLEADHPTYRAAVEADLKEMGLA